MICKGCNEDKKKLIDAHIIPYAFFKRLRKDANHLNIIGSENNGRIKKSPKGEYDQEILCAECDHELGLYDDYSIKLLIQRENEFKEICKNGKRLGWEVDFDFIKLSKFLLSVLWRASISKRPFFNLIDLGPHENIIKENIFCADSGANPNYQFVLSLFDSDSIADLEKTILGPYQVKIQGVNYCKLYLLGYVAWVKIDSRPTPNELSSFTAKESERLKIVESSFGSSKERSSIVSMHSKLRT